MSDGGCDTCLPQVLQSTNSQNLWRTHLAPLEHSFRSFASKVEAESSTQQSQAGQQEAAASSSGDEGPNQTEAPNLEELTAMLQEREKSMEDMQKKVHHRGCPFYETGDEEDRRGIAPGQSPMFKAHQRLGCKKNACGHL